MDKQKATYWKERYRQVLHETEQRDLAFRQSTRQMQRIVSRAILAAQGQDPQLDRILSGVRKNLPKLADEDRAGKVISLLDTTLLEAEDRHQQRVQSTHRSLLAMTSQLLQLQPRAQLCQSLQAYRAALSKTLTDIHLLPHQLSNYAQLQEQVLQSIQQAAADEDVFNQTTKQIQASLLRILDGMPARSPQQQQLESLRARIKLEFSQQELASIIDELAQLLEALYSPNQNEIKDQLNELNQRMHVVGENLQQTHEQFQEGIHLSALFDQQMQNQIQNFDDEFRQCDDLEKIKLLIEKRMGSFQSTLLDYNNQRSTQELSLQERFLAMQTDMQQMEQLTKKRIEELETQMRKRVQRMENLVFRRIQQMERMMQKASGHMDKQQSSVLLDPLTGVANRSGWDDRLRSEKEQLKDGNEPLSIALIDVDHFKSLAEDYDETAGDKVLKVVAYQLKRNIRQTDFLARYGTDKFALLLVNTNLDHAATMVVKLRKIIAATAFHFRNTPVQITVSAGVSQLEINESIEDVFSRSEKALIQAKRQGRNQVVTVVGRTTLLEHAEKSI